MVPSLHSASSYLKSIYIMNYCDRETYDYIFKFILIGNGNCGKTSLLYHFIHHKQKKLPAQTIGVEFSSTIQQVGFTRVKLQLWDTAGQERYRSIARTYYRGALGALILYDVTNSPSFQALEQWIRDAREFSKPDIEILVVGNKSDMLDERFQPYLEGRCISMAEAQRLCQDNYVSYIETSAINGTNVEEAFAVLSKKIIDKIDKGFLDGETLKPRFMQGLVTSKDTRVKEEGQCGC